MKDQRIKKFLLFGAVFLAYVLGCIGYYRVLANKDWPSALFYSFQMFVFNPPYFEKPIPIELHIGRWMGAGLFIYFTYQFISSLLNRPFLWFRKNHLIICGLNEFGTALALDAQNKGKQPVVIARDPDEKDIKKLLRDRISLIIGDPVDIATLNRANIRKADTIFALCNDDETNIEIACQIDRDLIRPRNSEKLKGFFFLKNPDLKAALIQNNLFPDSRMNIRWLNPYASRARKALFDLSLDHVRLPEGSGLRPGIIIIGFDHMGQSLALQTARVAHFPSGGKPLIHIVGRQSRIQDLHHHYPNLELAADLEWIGDTISDPTVKDRVTALCTANEFSRQILACAICHDESDVTNFMDACSLSRVLEHSQVPVLYYQAARMGFQPLMTSGHIITRLEKKKPIPFGMKEDIWTFDSITHEDQDAYAKANHQVYCNHRKKEREAKKLAGEGILEFRPAEKPWDELDETYRESNRAAADHLPIKLHALELSADLLKDGQKQTIPEISSEKIEMLSKMEHARWCAERWLDGWSEGQRNDPAKFHDDLVPWEKLNKPEQKIDKDLVGNLPVILKKEKN